MSSTNPSGSTPPKGRPTPKRREAQGSRGPVLPAPKSAKQARERRKAMAPTKEDRKVLREKSRQDATDRRARMMAGEDKFLAPRDKGPEKAYARDLVDSRLNISSFFMPIAIVMLVVSLLLPYEWQLLANFAMIAILFILLIEGLLMGRAVNKRVNERFPKYTGTGFKLGWYAFVRMMQFPPLRMPKPRVKRGQDV